jgi:tetratricopeptide (TPR) repeat protein
VLVVGVLGLVGGTICGLYFSTNSYLIAARAARRSENHAAAEHLLSACWRLPGLSRSIELENQLLGVQQGNLREEDHWRSQLQRPSGESSLILEALAKGSLATFRWNEAREYAVAILERAPGDPQGLWLRGRAWMKLQQEERARRDFLQAAERDPESIEIRLSLAEFFDHEGYPREAASEYEKVLQKQPQESRAVIGLARVLQDMAELSQSAQILDELIQVQPQLVSAYVERGRVALRMGKIAEAERILQQAIGKVPNHRDANLVLRRCLESRGARDEALEGRMEESERLRAQLTKRLRSTPNDPQLLGEIGALILKSGQEQEAVGWFFAALREDVRYVPAQLALADYFERYGQPQRAEAHRKLAGITSDAKKKIAWVDAAHRRVVNSAVKTVEPTREATAEDVHALCGACHAYPPPETMPRSAWRKEVKLGFVFLRDSKLQIAYPSLDSVVEYYEHRAPENLEAVERVATSIQLPVCFERQPGGWIPNVPAYPGVAQVTLAHLFDEQKLDLLACDTRLDRVLALKPYVSSATWQILGEVAVPSHAAVVDLDGNGRMDAVVASLGQFFPTDDKVGSVVWLRGLEGEKFDPVALLEGVGRVADVEAGDFNGDGKLDLIVAVFGWRNTGEILYLENQTTDWSKPTFVSHRVDERHGAIHVPVADLNADGRADFVALISQEHETVIGFLNEGGGRFRKETLFMAPHPSYGSSGIEVVDLDGDGDSDVLMTNGDILDRPYLLKPYHGLQWLENEGKYPFTHHSLGAMFGASRAVAADFDGDQDIDVVAVSFLPELEFPERERLGLESVVLFEQTEPRQFVRHVLERGTCDHFSCAVGDFDNDGRVDFAVGNFSWKRSRTIYDAAALWRNLGK